MKKLLLMLVLATLGGCQSTGHKKTAVPEATTIRVSVENQSFDDAIIYYVGNGGGPVRIGRVTGLSTTHLKVGRGLTSAGIYRFGAVFTGGQRAVSDVLNAGNETSAITVILLSTKTALVAFPSHTSR